MNDISFEDVIYFLEDKIKHGLETDEEYEFYITYKKYDNVVFKKYKKLLNKLAKEMIELYS